MDQNGKSIAKQGLSTAYTGALVANRGRGIRTGVVPLRSAFVTGISCPGICTTAHRTIPCSYLPVPQYFQDKESDVSPSIRVMRDATALGLRKTVMPTVPLLMELSRSMQKLLERGLCQASWK